MLWLTFVNILGVTDWGQIKGKQSGETYQIQMFQCTRAHQMDVNMLRPLQLPELNPVSHLF